jgi:hypothetical protein
MGVDGALRVGSRAYAFWICNLGGDSKRDRGVLAGGCLGLGSRRAKRGSLELRDSRLYRYVSNSESLVQIWPGQIVDAWWARPDLNWRSSPCQGDVITPRPRALILFDCRGIYG